MKNRSYIRDGRAPIPRREITSKIMSVIRAKNTKPEIRLRRALRKNRFGPFKINYRALPGRPDIFFPKEKLAIFVNGCYWHRCPYCKPKPPKTHKLFWGNKFKNNTCRDKLKARALRELGYGTITVWECQLYKNERRVIKRIQEHLLQRVCA